MKRVLLSLVVIFGLLISCYKPYNPDIKSNEKVVVVEGLITNEVGSYKIRLSYAIPFDTTGLGQPISSAHVYVTDDFGNKYDFNEKGNGFYISDSMQFTGHPNSSYILYIESPDGEVYRSDPQKLVEVFYSDSIYAKVDYQQTISRFNQIVVIIHGANMLVDIKSNSDKLPRFRFTSGLVRQYFYALNIPPPVFDTPLYLFYCWQTNNSNLQLNLAYNEYSENGYNINKHSVYFIDDLTSIDAFVYGLGTKNPDLSFNSIQSTERKSYIVMHRILYLNQYTLNNESYSYYKNMDEQLRSDGKLFDPIATQLNGNIKCITNPSRKVFGFFEASSVRHTAYVVGNRDHRNDQYSITNIPFIIPPEPNGCWINKAPPFWTK
jgi:hypothetical protein